MGIHFLTGFNQKKKFKWDSLILENKTDKIQSHEVFFVVADIYSLVFPIRWRSKNHNLCIEV